MVEVAAFEAEALGTDATGAGGAPEGGEMGGTILRLTKRLSA